MSHPILIPYLCVGVGVGVRYENGKFGTGFFNFLICFSNPLTLACVGLLLVARSPGLVVVQG